MNNVAEEMVRVMFGEMSREAVREVVHKDGLEVVVGAVQAAFNSASVRSTVYEAAGCEVSTEVVAAAVVWWAHQE